jgi:hypothetical protein
MSFFSTAAASRVRFSLSALPPVGYSTEALASFAHFTGADELTTSEKNALARFIDGQVSVGNWSKIKGMPLLSGLSTASKALIDIKNGVVATNNGATYSSATGFTTDGVATYINTNLTPSTIGTTINDVGVYIYPTAATTLISLGAVSTSPNTEQLVITYNASSRLLSAKVSSSKTTSKTMATDYPKAKVLMGGFREEASVAYSVYGADIMTNTVSDSSVGVPTVPVYIGAQNYNGAGSFGEASYGAFAIYNAVGFNHAAFNFYLEQLMVELGVSTADSLYTIADAPSYSNTDAILLNSEGQSNSLFAGKPTNLRYTELSSAITGANMFYMNPLANPPVMGDLEYLVNHTNDAAASGYSQFAAGLRLSKELTKQDLKYYIWAYNKSGTSLQAKAGKDWNATSTNEYLYETNEYLGTPILAAISEPIKKLIWHWNQGEGDTSRTTQEYTDDFYALLNAKMNFYESKGINFSTTDFHVIITQIWTGLETAYSGAINIINAQQAFSKANFEAAYPAHANKIKTFVVYDNEKAYHFDDVHVGAEGLHTEGYRLANYISKL